MSSALPHGELFSAELMKEIKDKFFYVDYDYTNKKRLFFDNAGGSFTLKSALDVYTSLEAIGDCPERTSKTADYLNEVINKGIDDIKLLFNETEGSVITMLTASQVIFEITRVAAENLPGSNIVTTKLEHPSAYDAAEYYAKKTGKELRVAPTNKETGGVDPETIAALIDENTSFLSVIYASNISGAILDMKRIVELARAKKPDLYIICDAVQHVPHILVDMQDVPVDAVNFAPYKFFGVRGLGVGFVSPRFAKLSHNKLDAKPEEDWELGSPAPAQYAAVSAIVDYVCWLGGKFIQSQNRRELLVEGMERIHLHERALMHRMLEGTSDCPGLRHLPHVNVYLDHPDLTKRDLIIAMEIENIEHGALVKEYEKVGVTVFERVATSLYSKRMLDSFDLAGAVRVSPLHCHDAGDIDEYLVITKQLAQKINS